MNTFNRRLAVRGAAAAGAAAAQLLAGCASLSDDGGFDRVGALTRERTGQTPLYQRNAAAGEAAAVRTGELLRQPVSAEAAVELALLNNRGLQAGFAELGIAEAALVRAGRLRNPVLGFGRLQGGAGGVEIERSLVFDVLGLLTLPLVRGIEQQRFEQVQLQAAQAAVALAADTRRAWISAVAASELLRFHRQVKEAADAAGELARRMRQAGNFNALAQLREQLFQAEATAQLTRAQQRSQAERERLLRLLGLDAGQLPALVLPERLPDVPAEPLPPQRAEQAAIEQRLDVQLARRATAATARALGLSRATGFVNVFELGVQNKREGGAPRAGGFVVELELPLFDFGAARTAQAEAAYLQALHRTADVALQARSQVREAHAAYRTAYDLARHHRDEVVPLRKRISQENLLRYNGMLIGVFDLLADAREQVGAVTAYVEALRDFWLAEADLQAALAGGVR